MVFVDRFDRSNMLHLFSYSISQVCVNCYKYDNVFISLVKVSLSVGEYQELKAQAMLASLADGDTPGAREGGGAGGGAAGEVWMRLDQKNKVRKGIFLSIIHNSFSPVQLTTRLFIYISFQNL